ncbi:MAG: FtsQ-type POTRA domain-containing protein [Cyanobacteria bacterium P01_A01_bin.3]
MASDLSEAHQLRRCSPVAALHLSSYALAHRSPSSVTSRGLYRVTMPELKSTTRHQLKERQQQVRQQLRQQLQSRLWRWTLTAGLLAGGVYAARLPVWKVQLAHSVEVNGNELLADRDILAFVPPIDSLYIWQVEPHQVEAALLENPFLKTVRVRRQLFPPHISAEVEERQAIAIGSVAGAPGFIDTEGQWISSTDLPPDARTDWPTLTVMGWEPGQKRDWAELLFVLQHSVVEIRAVDWRTPSNLVLQTELGEVHFGQLPEDTHPDTPLGRSPLAHAVKERLQGLNQLSGLYDGPCNCQPSDVEHINISQPQLPTIALTDAAAEVRFPSRWLFAPPPSRAVREAPIEESFDELTTSAPTPTTEMVDELVDELADETPESVPSAAVEHSESPTSPSSVDSHDDPRLSSDDGSPP